MLVVIFIGNLLRNSKAFDNSPRGKSKHPKDACLFNIAHLGRSKSVGALSGAASALALNENLNPRRSWSIVGAISMIGVESSDERLARTAQ
jgi:hypothetical protein